MPRLSLEGGAKDLARNNLAVYRAAMGVQCKARAAAKAGGLGKGRNAAMGRQGKREIAKLFRARS